MVFPAIFKSRVCAKDVCRIITTSVGSSFSENFLPLGTDNVREQYPRAYFQMELIVKHIFMSEL